MANKPASNTFVWIVMVFFLCFFVVFILSFLGVPASAIPAVLFWTVAIIVVITVIMHYRHKKLPGGSKAAVLQGIWVLHKHLKYDPVMKKYESVPVEKKKSYFEFKGDQFRSGDFDEKHKQMPADFSKYSVVGDNLIFDSESLKKASWKWAMTTDGLELTAETADGNKSKYYFNMKNWL